MATNRFRVDLSRCLAGGGLAHCGAWGETDEISKKIVSSPVSVPDFFATIYSALGVSPDKENYSGVRPIPLAPFGHNVVKDILA